ncbi:hypothetical protein N9J26_01515 [bacterium]|nr:hypothetical protein [bacterium]
MNNDYWTRQRVDQLTSSVVKNDRPLHEGRGAVVNPLVERFTREFNRVKKR